MTLPPQITYRNMEPEPRLEEAVLKEAARLERFFDRIMSCRVMIQGPKRQQRNLYSVRIDLGVPNEDLIIEHHPSLHGTLQDLKGPRKSKKTDLERSHRDAVRAIRDAFAEMRRRLQDYVRRMRGRTKQHEPRIVAKVAKLFPESDYGFLETPDGQELYFHRNSVLDGRFEHLRVGSDVHFVEEPGEQGPQASTVKLVRAPEQARAAARTEVLRTVRPARRKAG
jgi:cold shock CspA family protein/ribosome-associated translation inhibitor RaiA